MWWRIKKIQYFGNWYVKCKMKIYLSWINIFGCCLIAITKEKWQRCVKLVLWWILNKRTCLIWDVAGILTITNMVTMRTFVILFDTHNEGRISFKYTVFHRNQIKQSNINGHVEPEIFTVRKHNLFSPRFSLIFCDLYKFHPFSVKSTNYVGRQMTHSRLQICYVRNTTVWTRVNINSKSDRDTRTDK